MRPDPGFQGFSLCSSTAIVLSPLIVAGHVGEAGLGRQWGNFPRSPGASPPRSPHRLSPPRGRGDTGENGWRASTFGTEQAAPACGSARGVRRSPECLPNKCHRPP